jgi:4a-hydroxytetrahydrobiopterin dehydratase
MPQTSEPRPVTAPARVALNGPQLVANLARVDGWRLFGDGAAIAIEKSYTFKNYLRTMAFVNAVAFIAEKYNHHPELMVRYNTCSVRFNTHDIGGISRSDFECAAAVDALLQDAAAP